MQYPADGLVGQLYARKRGVHQKAEWDKSEIRYHFDARQAYRPMEFTEMSAIHLRIFKGKH
jgi:hypothetical protein